jgi:hypothetical protein
MPNSSTAGNYSCYSKSRIFFEVVLHRYVGASWDLGELVAAKDDIINKNLLVTKLAVPSNSA